ncbi:MAG: acyl-CoA dehydrogenase [Proteobacteria bacterium]|nr:MAG: acyl-CoA dehydrogenase [Pseudomonadota bacterium]
MNFGFTEEQDLLRQEVRKFLDAHCPLEEVRKLMETPEGFSRDLWKQMGELGWIGLTVAEAHGGAGLGWVDLTVVLEEMGRTLFPSPYLATTIAAAAIREAGSAEQQARWLPQLADGSKIASLAHLEPSDRWDLAGVALDAKPQGGGVTLNGAKVQVLDAPAADLFVVSYRSAGGVGLALVERNAAGVAVEATPSIDATRRVGRVRFDGVAVAADALLANASDAALGRVLDLATAAVTAEMLGAAEQDIRITVQYAKEREQFGHPIGRFQGVKHPLAEMFVDVESAKSILYYAAWALDERDADAPRAVSLAKAYASEAFARVGVDAVQLHGGVGFTWEYDPHLYLKRSKWARPAFGDADFHYDRVIQFGEAK